MRGDIVAVQRAAPRQVLQQALEQEAVGTGAQRRCRSAISALAVRRGSISTTRMPGRAALAVRMR
jgi:hypothetical protein